MRTPHGDLRDRDPSKNIVIPAQAGIHSCSHANAVIYRLRFAAIDSRLRVNDNQVMSRRLYA